MHCAYSKALIFKFVPYIYRLLHLRNRLIQFPGTACQGMWHACWTQRHFSHFHCYETLCRILLQAMVIIWQQNNQEHFFIFRLLSFLDNQLFSLPFFFVRTTFPLL